MIARKSSVASLLACVVWFVAAMLAAFPVLAAPVLVSISKSGSGTGTVTAGSGAISCAPTCSGTYETGTVLTLTATPLAGSVFTGWLGPCTGNATCQFTVTAATTAGATFAAAGFGGRILDIDGTATCEALTDGLLAARHLFGLAGAALVSGAVGQGAGRNDVQIAAWLQDIHPLLDIDGDGRADAWTDGLLIIRYYFGIRGQSLIAGAVAPGAIRTTSGAIESRIGGLCVTNAPTFALTANLAGL